MSNNELLPCPFCGENVKLEKTESYYNEQYGVRQWWGVVCRSTKNAGGTCAIQSRPAASEEAAIARWNMRTSQQYTAVDVASADADGFRNGRASVAVDLSDLSNCFSPNDCGDWAMWLDDVKKLIIAAGGTVKS